MESGVDSATTDGRASPPIPLLISQNMKRNKRGLWIFITTPLSIERGLSMDIQKI
jgi:hypothetical protein